MNKQRYETIMASIANKEKFDILIGKNEEELYFLIGERFRPKYRKQKNTNHKKWAKREIANNRLNGKIVDNVFIHYGAEVINE